MLADLLRLTDEHIQKVFQLCYAILVTEDLALRATNMSLSALSLEADNERARIKRIVRKRFGRKISAEEVETNYQFLLQRIVLDKTQHFEKEQERDPRTRSRLHEDTWLLRYFKHIIWFSFGEEHSATSAYCRVIHDYSRETTQRVHTFLVQRNPSEKKGLEEFSKWKTRIDDKVLKRFDPLLIEKKEKGNVRRFVTKEDAEEKKSYVIACLKLFKPWEIDCVLPPNISESAVIKLLQRNSDDPIREQYVRYRRLSTLLDYECFSRMMRIFDRLPPREHLLIPQLVLPINSADKMMPPADLNDLPELSTQKRGQIRAQLAEQSVRRQRLMPRWLRIVVDGEPLQNLYDLYSSRNILIPLDKSTNTIEVWASDSDELIPLSFKTLSWLKPSLPTATMFSTKLEAGQRISWTIIHKIAEDGDVVPSEVRIQYRESNWSRALSFQIRRLQESAGAQIIPQRFSDALHAWLLEYDRAINMALRVFPLFIALVIVIFVGRSIWNPWQSENIAKSGPPSASSPSPSPSSSRRDEVASASPPVKLVPAIPGRPGGSPNGEKELRTGHNVDQKSLALREVRSVFIDPQSDDFKALLRESLMVRLREAGFITDVEENEADARLSMRETRRRLVFSLVSGKMEIWSDQMSIEERTPIGAQNLAARLTARLEEARKR